MSDAFSRFVDSHFLIGLGGFMLFCEIFFSSRVHAYDSPRRITLGIASLVVCGLTAYRVFDGLSSASSGQLFAFVGAILGTIGSGRLLAAGRSPANTVVDPGTSA